MASKSLPPMSGTAVSAQRSSELRSGRSSGRSGRRRDSVATRSALVDSAFTEIHRDGFRAASLDAILANAGVTKGALYHHFPTKRDLGLAVVDEVIGEFVDQSWRGVFESDEPLQALDQVLANYIEMSDPELLVLGCPLNNLAQEMAPIDADFQKHLAAIQTRWREQLVVALQRGQRNGSVRSDCDADSVAALLIAMHQGTIGIAKNERSPELAQRCINEIRNYLRTLAP